MPNTQLAAIRAAYDAAQAEAERDGAAPEGLSTIDPARILYEAWAAEQLVLIENDRPGKVA